MAQPNIVNVTTIYGNTAAANVTNSATAIVSNAVGSGQVVKINSLYIASTNSNTSFAVFTDLLRPSAAFPIANNIVVPNTATLTVVTKDAGLYLQEGDSIRVWANTASIYPANAFTAVCSYESIS
jgi:hypothetical protein